VREKTYLTAIAFIDFMLILAGGVMAWQQGMPSRPGGPGKPPIGNDPVSGIISIILIAGIGAWLMYEMNEFAFRIAESPATRRNAVLSACLFVGVTVTGGLIGLTMG
jgi:hypothetical protein